MLVPLSALQIKTTQLALLAPARIPRRTRFFSTDFPPRKSLQKLSPKAHFSKKAAANLVQVPLNSFSISIFAPKNAPQKHEKTNQNRPFSPLFGLFSALFGLFFAPLFTPISASFSPQNSRRREDHRSSSPNANPPPCARRENRANRPRFRPSSIACQEGSRQTLLQVPYFSATHSQPKFADNLPQIA